MSVRTQSEKPNAAMVVKIGLPPSLPNPDTEKANKKANYNLGAGAAESFLNCVKAQGVSLKVYLQAIADGDQQWRKGFRVALEHHRDAMNEYVKQNPNNPVYTAAAKSAKPRISEAIGFSKAMDTGFSPDMSQGYHAIIGASVAFRNSKSSADVEMPSGGNGEDGKGKSVPGTAKGPTQKKNRGRKPIPILDKVKKFLLSLNATAEELDQVAVMATTLAKIARSQAK